MVVGSSSYSQTFSPNWHVEFILGNVSGFFSHANEAERKTVLLSKRPIWNLSFLSWCLDLKRLSQNYCHSLCAFQILILNLNYNGVAFFLTALDENYVWLFCGHQVLKG